MLDERSDFRWPQGLSLAGRTAVGQAVQTDAIRSFLRLARQRHDADLVALMTMGGADLYLDAAEDIEASAIASTHFFTFAGCADAPVIVQDATRHVQLGGDPIVQSAPYFRSLAGISLKAANGLEEAILAVFDRRPGAFGVNFGRDLNDAANLASALIGDVHGVADHSSVAQQVASQARLIGRHAALLTRKRDTLDTAMAAAGIGVWECDLDTDALSWTDGVYDLFGLPRRSKITRREATKFYTPASLAELEAVRKEALAKRSGFTLDVQIRTAHDDLRTMRITAQVEHSSRGPMRLFGVKQDMTSAMADLRGY